MTLFCDIYKGSRDEELYVYVEFGAGVESLPASLLTRLGKPSKVMSLTLTPDKKLARANAGRVIEAIKEQGFYLQMPPSPFPVHDTESN